MISKRKEFNIYSQTGFFTSTRGIIYELIKLLKDHETILDVGCGKLSPLRFLPFGHLTAVEGYKPDLDEAVKNNTHDDYLLLDIKHIAGIFKLGSFDACVALDVIEHFEKEEGLRLLKDLEIVAKKRVVILTPNGFLPQESHSAGDFQKHLSGWTTEEMRELGYNVIGLCGWKSLRGAYQQLKFKPVSFWAIVSLFSQKIWCRSNPESASALLCWKDIAA